MNRTIRGLELAKDRRRLELLDYLLPESWLLVGLMVTLEIGALGALKHEIPYLAGGSFTLFIVIMLASIWKGNLKRSIMRRTDPWSLHDKN